MAAMQQAEQDDVAWTNTMRIAAKIHTEVFGSEKTKTIALVDALLDTDMRLPVTSGAQLFE